MSENEEIIPDNSGSENEFELDILEEAISDADIDNGPMALSGVSIPAEKLQEYLINSPGRAAIIKSKNIPDNSLAGVITIEIAASGVTFDNFSVFLVGPEQSVQFNAG